MRLAYVGFLFPFRFCSLHVYMFFFCFRCNIVVTTNIYNYSTITVQRNEVACLDDVPMYTYAAYTNRQQTQYKINSSEGEKYV